jgi:hypothetical protein
MSNVRRFYFIQPPRGCLIHRSTSRIEGDKTFCGARLRLGWKWVGPIARGIARKFKGYRDCPRCAA